MVKSEVEVGSDFYFSIPVKIGKEIKEGKQYTEIINFQERKILLVEDNKANQLYMQVLLKKMGLGYDIAMMD